jgi:hypothetical protein
MADFTLMHWRQAETAEAVTMRLAKDALNDAANALSWHPALREKVALIIDEINGELPTYQG